MKYALTDIIDAQPMNAKKFSAVRELLASGTTVKDTAAAVGFRANTAPMVAARFADREASVHVEEQIYSGFYSGGDQRLLDRFQTASWEERPAILDQITDQRARQLGRRLLYLHRPDLLDAAVVDTMNNAIRDRWNSDDPKVPWMTFAEVEKQLAEIEEAGALHGTQVGALEEFYQSSRV